MMPVEMKVETPSVIQEIRKISSSNKIASGLLSRRGILLLFSISTGDEHANPYLY